MAILGKSFICAFVSKLYDLVQAEGWWCCIAGIMVAIHHTFSVVLTFWLISLEQSSFTVLYRVCWICLVRVATTDSLAVRAILAALIGYMIALFCCCCFCILGIMVRAATSTRVVNYSSNFLLLEYFWLQISISSCSFCSQLTNCWNLCKLGALWLHLQHESLEIDVYMYM